MTATAQPCVCCGRCTRHTYGTKYAVCEACYGSRFTEWLFDNDKREYVACMDYVYTKRAKIGQGISKGGNNETI